MKLISTILFSILIFYVFFRQNFLYSVHSWHSSLQALVSIGITNSSQQDFVASNSSKNKIASIQDRVFYQQQSCLDNIIIHQPDLGSEPYRLNSKKNSLKIKQSAVSDNPSYTLQNAAITSAGVFDGDVLVRTLWSNEKRNAGTYDLSTVWDGKDDNGNSVADKNYTIKVVTNNVKYEWLRPIGNTSDSDTGSTVHHPFQTYTNMVQVGNELYLANGYNEVGEVHSKVSVNAPNQLKTTLKGGGQIIRFLASDGNIVYSAGQRDGSTAFITGIVPNPSGTDALAKFSAGIPYGMPTGSPYTYSAFNITGNNNFITGLAVQQSGNYLFASHKTLNQLRVFNKITGAIVRIIGAVNSPRELAIQGNNLWLISETNTISKYTINSDGTISSTTIRLSGLTDPLSVAISPDGSKVAIADRGIYHQVKIFNTSTGTIIKTIGRTEDYSNPAAYNDKFYFNNTKIFREDDYGTAHAFVAFQSDGSLWVGDYGNMRCQHFDVNGNFMNTIQHVGMSYSTQVDVNNPVRVFSNFLEFNVNYTDNSWTFVKNWSKNINRTRDYDDTRMRSVTTLSNGRTYCLYQLNNPGAPMEVLELVPSTGIRHTGVMMDDGACQIESNGYISKMGDGALGKSDLYQVKPLTGFDSNNNPTWGSYTTIETIPSVTVSDPISSGPNNNRMSLTSSSVLSTFNIDNGSGTRGKGYHLGGFRNGKWLFKTSYATHNQYIGSYPEDGAFDIGNGPEFNNRSPTYSGSFMQTVDRNIFWGYKGEFWKQSQTNKYNHYLDSGLMIGQFGEIGNVARWDGREAVAGAAGNANTGTYVKVGNDIHFFHCDEGQHAGVHHWKISNLNSIKETSILVTKASVTNPPIIDYVDLLAGVPKDKSLQNNLAGWTRSPTGDLYVGPYNRWQIQTHHFTYRKQDNDIHIMAYPGSKGQSFAVKRELPVQAVSSWTLTAEISYPVAGEPGENALEILDNNNRVIARFLKTQAYPNSVWKHNTTILINQESNSLLSAYGKLQPLRIYRNGSQITIQYANLPAVTAPVVDNLANIGNPRMLLWRGVTSQTYQHELGIANLRFYPGLSVIVGTGSGLTGKYFNNKTLSEPSTSTRTDSTVNFNWGLASPMPGRLNTDGFSIQWNGQVQAPISGTYIFSTSVDDGVRLWINGIQVINNWGYHATTDNTVPIVLVAGQKYDIKLEYYDGAQGASIRLMWAYPNQAQQIIPKKWLYAATPNGRSGSDTEEIAGENDTQNNMKAYPVPAHDFILINYYAKETGDLSIHLINVNAQPVLQMVHPITQGENTLKLSVKEFDRGMYILNIIQGNRRISQRVILAD